MKYSAPAAVFTQALSLVLLLPGVSSAQQQMRVYQVRNPLPVPDVAGYKVLKCDFHVHTAFSGDSQVWPALRILEAWRDGLDAIAITDHVDATPPHGEILKPDLALAFKLARPQAERHGILLIPGAEVSPGELHCNALFVKDPNEVKGMDLITALRKLRAQDAFVFWNHPGADETPRWPPEIAAAHREGLIQGVELVNEDHFYPDVFPLIEEKKLTIFCNSDIHLPIPPQTEAYTRPITLVFVRQADLGGVREALVSRRTAAWMGGEVWGPEDLLRGLWEGAVRVEPPQLEFHPNRWGPRVPIHNSSAIPFKFRVRQAPAWLSAGAGEVPAQRIFSHSIGVRADAPAGSHRVELELEITNLHVGPGRNLIVRLPLQIKVAR